MSIGVQHLETIFIVSNVMTMSDHHLKIGLVWWGFACDIALRILFGLSVKLTYGWMSFLSRQYTFIAFALRTPKTVLFLYLTFLYSHTYCIQQQWVSEWREKSDFLLLCEEGQMSVCPVCILVNPKDAAAERWLRSCVGRGKEPQEKKVDDKKQLPSFSLCCLTSSGHAYE